jgi:hypothetical protein
MKISAAQRLRLAIARPLQGAWYPPAACRRRFLHLWKVNQEMQNVGLFTAARSTPPSIASGTTVVASSGYNAEGLGAAQYKVDPAVPTGTSSSDITARTDYLNRFPRGSFVDSSNRVFRIDGPEVNPYMFGAIGNGTTDDSDAVQAFFDDAFVDRGLVGGVLTDDAAQAARVSGIYYNMDGSFGVSKAIYAVYFPTQELTRRFRGGRLLVLTPAVMPVEDLLTIAGYRQVWDGELAVQQVNVGNTTYANRRFRNGIRMLACSRSSFEVIRVDGARGDAVAIDARTGLPWTIRDGSSFAVTFPDRNNIALRIRDLIGRYCGSCNQSSSNYRYQVAIASITQGSDPTDPAVTFTAGDVGASNTQRSRLEVADNGELRPLDVGKVRLELGTTHYGTVAADATAKTLTFSSGDAVTLGLQVGDTIIPQSGANIGKIFVITGITGSPARVIQLDKAPVQEAATAITGLFTDFSYHVIQNVETVSGVEYIDVYPYVPTRTNSVWYSMHGWLANIRGGDTAAIHIEYIGALLSAGGLASGGLYGPEVGSITTDHCEVAILHGFGPTAAQLGTVVHQIHAEGTTLNLLQVTTSMNARLIVNGGSSFDYSKVLALYVRTTATAALQSPRALFTTTMDLGGELLQAVPAPPYSGGSTLNGDSVLSNSPQQRLRTIIGNSGTVELAFKDDIARVFAEHHWAELFWVGAAAGAPTGTLNFTLSSALTADGWTIAGGSSVTAPSKPCLFKVRFHKPTKQALITRFDAA